MVGLKPPGTAWQDVIHDTAVQFMKSYVCLFEEVSDPGDWDPRTGGGEPTVNVIWKGKARVQHISTVRPFNGDYATGDTRNFLFQLDPDDNPPAFIAHNSRWRVLHGGRDEALESLLFVADSAINSQDMAVRSVNLKATMRKVDWAWDEEVPEWVSR